MTKKCMRDEKLLRLIDTERLFLVIEEFFKNEHKLMDKAEWNAYKKACEIWE